MAGPVPVWLDEGRGLALVDEVTGELADSATRAARVAAAAALSAERRGAELARAAVAQRAVNDRGGRAVREALAAAQIRAAAARQGALW